MIGLDVETTALSPDEGDLRLVQLARGGRVQLFDLYDGEGDSARSTVQEALAGNLVAHNAVFERKWLKVKLGIDIGIIDDTRIMSQVQLHGQEGDAEQAVLAQPAGGGQTRAQARDKQRAADERLGRRGTHARADRVRRLGREGDAGDGRELPPRGLPSTLRGRRQDHPRNAQVAARHHGQRLAGSRTPSARTSGRQGRGGSSHARSGRTWQRSSPAFARGVRCVVPARAYSPISGFSGF
jgi:hypothetical protein